MPPIVPTWLSIITFEPRIGSPDVPPDACIRVRFNQALDEATINSDELLNPYVVLVRLDMDTEVIPVNFTDYDTDTNTLICQPSSALAPGAFYQVTIRRQLRGAAGRSMAVDRTWNFRTSQSPIGCPELVAPSDSTAFHTAPTLQWQGITAVSGTVNYDIELNTSWEFGNTLTWETTQNLTAAAASGLQEVAIGTSLATELTYYWRVRCWTSTVTGDWTEPWAFYVGNLHYASPDTQVDWSPHEHFDVARLQPAGSVGNLQSWPTIQANFTQPVSGNILITDFVQMWKEPVDGAVKGTSGLALVAGEIVLNDNIIQFQPAEPILANTRYTFVINEGLRSQCGEHLASTAITYFTGWYFPLYGGLLQVRNVLGEVLADVSDDEIYYSLWRASLEVNQILIYNEPLCRDYKEITWTELISHRPKEITWGIIKYTEYQAAEFLLKSRYYGLLRKAGERKTLGVYERATDLELLKEMKALIREIFAEKSAPVLIYYGTPYVPVPSRSHSSTTTTSTHTISPSSSVRDWIISDVTMVGMAVAITVSTAIATGVVTMMIENTRASLSYVHHFSQ